MPILLADETEIPILPDIGQLPGAGAVEPEAEEGPTTGETLAAAFRLENTVASGTAALNDGIRQDDEIDPDVNFEDFIPERFKTQAEHYAFVNNQEQADFVTRKIDRELEDRRTIEEAGTLGIVSMFAAAMIDPVNLIPVGGTAYKTYRVGASILKGATTTAKAGLLSSSAAEAVLQHTQTQRTLGEGAVNITAGTFLSGALGASFGAFRTLGKQGRLGRAKEFAEEVAAGSDPGRRSGPSDINAKVKANEETVTQSIDDDLTVPPPEEPDPIMPYSVGQTAEDLAVDTGGSVGAAAGRPTNLADEAIKSALGMERVVRFQDPLLRTATSGSIKTRQTSQRLAEQILTYEKNALGIETPLAVETRIAQHNVGLFKAIKNLDNEFIKYRRGREKKFLDIPKIGISDIGGAARRGEKLTYHEFKQEVSRAMRNNDEHPVPEVASAAKKFRAEVFDPLKDDAISLGLLGDDVEVQTAPSYLMRVYNVEKIIAERPEFQRRVVRWLKEQRDIQAARAPELKTELDEALAELPLAKKAVDKLTKDETPAIKKEIKAAFKEVEERIKTLQKEQARAEFKAGFEDIELDDVSDQIIDRILGTPDGRLPYDINPNVSKGGAGGRAALSGPLKGRSFLIPDAEIEDFLENDIEHLARVYTRSMSSDLELIREFDDVNMTNQIDDIRRDYSQKMEAKGLTKKDLIGLNKAKDADIRDIAAMRDRIRGIYAMPADPTSIIVRGARVVRTLNYLRLLGGMTPSAFPDIMRAVMVHGLGRTFGDGIVPLIRNFKATKLAAEEVRLSGTALDMVLDSRTMQIADLMDDFGRHSKFERGIKSAQDKFSVVSVMAPWNAFFKQWTGMITMTRMLKGMKGIAEGKPAAKEIEKLASMGINPEQAKRIWGFFKEHGQIDDGVYLPNTEAWTGPGAQEAVNAFRGALKKQVDIIIVTPGQDKPLWMSTELGKLIGQFKSFAIASVQRTMLTGLQQRDLAALNGALLSVAAGMAVYGFKQNDAGREISDDPRVWITEGLDRSGMFGWFFDVNNIIEKTTRGRVGMNAITGGPQMSRYASRNVVGALLGPTSGFIKDLTTVTGDISQGEWAESDTRALRRLLPYQNLVGFRRVLDKAEAGINDALGVEQRRK